MNECSTCSTSLLAFGNAMHACAKTLKSMDCSSQAPLSMGFSRQEYWSGLPCSPPEDLLDPGNQTIVSHIAGRFLTIWATGKALTCFLVKTLGGPMSSTLVQYPPLWDSWLASHQQRTLVWQGICDLHPTRRFSFLLDVLGVHRARTRGLILGAEGGSSQHHSGNWGAQLLAGRKQDAANTLLQSRIKHVSLSAKVIPQLSLRWDQPSLVHTLTAILWDLQAEASQAVPGPLTHNILLQVTHFVVKYDTVIENFRFFFFP